MAGFEFFFGLILNVAGFFLAWLGVGLVVGLVMILVWIGKQPITIPWGRLLGRQPESPASTPAPPLPPLGSGS